MKYQDRDITTHAQGLEAVREVSSLVREKIREREKTRRLLLIIAAFTFIFGSIIITFAPDNRQNIAHILGAVMIVFALGSIGASNFVLKILGVVEITASEERILRETTQS